MPIMDATNGINKTIGELGEYLSATLRKEITAAIIAVRRDGIMSFLNAIILLTNIHYIKKHYRARSR